ncbi:MAG: FKBP-type peptidyl-prolyl cis-trans isomerase [Chloroflexota bacterium]
MTLFPSAKQTGVILLLSVALLSLAAAGCRDSSSAPNSGDVPVITPTPAEINCLNDQYPEEAPEFGDESAIDYTTLDSGLQVFHREEGTGDSPPNDAQVTIRYTGFFTDGCVFDTSYDDAEDTVTFPLNSLIPGWQEGVARMHEGGSARLRVPPQLAYGERGFRNVIPPNSTLIFEIELVEFSEAEDGSGG